MDSARGRGAIGTAERYSGQEAPTLNLHREPRVCVLYADGLREPRSGQRWTHATGATNGEHSNSVFVARTHRGVARACCRSK